MSSSKEFVQFVAEQFSGAGTIAYKSMFGEYGLYCNGKFFAMICDDRLLVKITTAGKKLMPDCPTALPYEGAKPAFYIEDVENHETLKQLAIATCEELPAPKPKKPKKKKIQTSES